MFVFLCVKPGRAFESLEATKKCFFQPMKGSSAAEFVHLLYILELVSWESAAAAPKQIEVNPIQHQTCVFM